MFLILFFEWEILFIGGFYVKYKIKGNRLVIRGERRI